MTRPNAHSETCGRVFGRYDATCPRLAVVGLILCTITIAVGVLAICAAFCGGF